MTRFKADFRFSFRSSPKGEQVGNRHSSEVKFMYFGPGKDEWMFAFNHYESTCLF
jgi:hypothetical protein